MGGQRKKQAQRSHNKDFMHKSEVEKLLVDMQGAIAPTIFAEDSPEEKIEKRGLMKKATDWIKNKIFPNS